MASHPFLPESLDLPHYVPNALSMTYLLAVFFGVVLAVVVVSGVAVQKFKIKGSNAGLFLWFVCSGLIHFILEGYFAYNNQTIAGMNTFLAELWKEYALADSRYMSSDPFVLTMESCTAFVEGPLCLLVAYAIATRAPWRHPIQMTVSIGQFYGCVLYFATSEWSTVKYGPPGHPIYFWFYYVFMNAIWIVIPGYCIVQSICASTAAFAAQAKASASNKAK